ncbi:MAG TPA: two-component system regulatory protein YycI, partial [Bacillales bacterium]|nr:two-component system regulatory protein YycI [Bacillales bacterium]
MNWSRAKSIFLVTFLVLDLFLGYQLYNKRQNADNVLLNGTASPQKRMKVSLISWPDHLPTIKSAAYLKGTSMSFVTESTKGGSDSKTGSGSGKGGQTEKLGNGDNGTNAVKKVSTVQKRLIKEVRDLETINGQKIQTIRAKEETTIVSTLVKPVEVNLDTSEPFKDFLKNDVYKGSEYTIWKQGGENSPYILVQTFNDCPVFSKGQSEAASSGGQFPPGTLK